MISPLRIPVLVLLIAAVMSAGACSSSEPKPKNKPLAEVLQQPPAPAPSSKDPCPELLHDIGGSLLLYYYQNKRLPPALDDLKATSVPGPKITTLCPDSHKPYVYVPDGLTLPDVRGRILVYDAQPTRGWRWTIIMPEVAPPNAPVVKVVAVPESRFATVPDK